jgi:hypothetical protein
VFQQARVRQGWSCDLWRRRDIGATLQRSCHGTQHDRRCPLLHGNMLQACRCNDNTAALARPTVALSHHLLHGDRCMVAHCGTLGRIAIAATHACVAEAARAVQLQGFMSYFVRRPFHETVFSAPRKTAKLPLPGASDSSVLLAPTRDMFACHFSLSQSQIPPNAASARCSDCGEVVVAVAMMLHCVVHLAAPGIPPPIMLATHEQTCNKEESMMPPAVTMLPQPRSHFRSPPRKVTEIMQDGPLPRGSCAHAPTATTDNKTEVLLSTSPGAR